MTRYTITAIIVAGERLWEVRTARGTLICTVLDLALAQAVVRAEAGPARDQRAERRTA